MRSSAQDMEWLPEAARRFLRRRLGEGCGVLLLAAGALLLLALMGYSPQDPSWNHITDAPAENILGDGGAWISDIIFQSFGWGGFLFCLPPAYWGWRLLCHRPVTRLRWRLPAWLVAPAFAAALFSLAPQGWEGILPSGTGGALGAFLSGSMNAALQTYLEPGPLTDGIAAAVSALLSLLLLTWAMGGGLRWALFFRRSTEEKDALTEKGSEAEKWRRRRDVEPGWLRILGYHITDAAESFLSRLRRPWGRDEEASASEEKAIASAPRRRGGKTSASKATGKRGTGKKDTQSALQFEGKATAAPYQLPSLTLLEVPTTEKSRRRTQQELRQETDLLESTLSDFGVKGEIKHIRNGPVVTLYELEPASGVKSSRVIGLADDIARSMSAVSTRIAVVPGRNAIGIELPNEHRETVPLRDLLASPEYGGQDNKMRLAVILGKSITGEPVIVDLARMPHLLIAGTTGSGKSVAINALILSLLYRLAPEQCRLIMIDPKMLELSVYDDIPHLLTPVVTDPKQAVVALKWLVREMENRYRRISKLGVRNIETYNQRIGEAARKGERLTRTVQTGVDADSGRLIYEEEELSLERMPYIVVIVDEMADLMLVAGKEIEIAIQRLAQMARAAGIHMITATQRPSVDVITGTIKANFPNRISFRMASKIDSRTILGEQGAEQLLGRGDMLYMSGGGRIERIHGAFLSDEDVEKVVRFVKQQGAPDYQLDVITPSDEDAAAGADFTDGEGDADQSLYNRALSLIQNEKYASTSYIQRKLRIGYNRSARIIEQMEADGIISAPNHVGRREVLNRAAAPSHPDS